MKDHRVRPEIGDQNAGTAGDRGRRSQQKQAEIRPMMIGHMDTRK